MVGHMTNPAFSSKGQEIIQADLRERYRALKPWEPALHWPRAAAWLACVVSCNATVQDAGSLWVGGAPCAQAQNLARKRGQAFPSLVAKKSRTSRFRSGCSRAALPAQIVGNMGQIEFYQQRFQAAAAQIEKGFAIVAAHRRTRLVKLYALNQAVAYVAVQGVVPIYL